MINDDYINKDSTSQCFEELKSIINICEDPSIRMKDDIYDNSTDCHESLLSSTMSSVDSTPENSLMDDNIPSHENSHQISCNSKELFINDSFSGRPRRPRQNEFLYLLLQNLRYSSYVSWLDKDAGLFKIHQGDRVATLWKQVKNRHTNGKMDYDTFARGIRYYFKSGLMIKTHKKYTFRFKTPIVIQHN